MRLGSKLRIIWERFNSCPHLDKDGEPCIRCRWHEMPHVSEGSSRRAGRIWGYTVRIRRIPIFGKSIYGIK